MPQAQWPKGLTYNVRSKVDLQSSVMNQTRRCTWEGNTWSFPRYRLPASHKQYSKKTALSRILADMHLLFFHKKQTPEAPTWSFVSNLPFESSQKWQNPWACTVQERTLLTKRSSNFCRKVKPYGRTQCTSRTLQKACR